MVSVWLKTETCTNPGINCQNLCKPKALPIKEKHQNEIPKTLQILHWKELLDCYLMKQLAQPYPDVAVF